VRAHRRGLLRRIAAELGDLQRARARQRDTEAALAAALASLGLARPGDIPGLTATGAAAILAGTGGPERYDTSSSLARHAGMSPSDNASGAFDGEAHISRRGRPSLRLTAWRAVWPMLIHNPLMAAKYRAMTAAADQAAAGAQDDGAGRAGHASAAGDPEAAAGVVLPVVPGAPPSRRAGAGLSGGDQLPAGVSTRRVEKLAASPGVTGLSKSQVSLMASELDEMVESFRSRRLDAGRPVHVRVDRRADPEGPRGRPDRQRARPYRHRRQRRRAPRPLAVFHD